MLLTVFACIFKSEFGLPLQLLIGTSRVGRQIKHITRSPLHDIVLERVTNDLAESINHLKHGAAASGSQIPGPDARLLLAEVVQRSEMAFGEINYMDVVPDGSSVSG